MKYYLDVIKYCLMQYKKKYFYQKEELAPYLFITTVLNICDEEEKYLVQDISMKHPGRRYSHLQRPV